LNVLDLTTATRNEVPETVTTGQEILGFQQLVRMVPIADTVARYAVDIVRATRPRQNGESPDFVDKYVNFGGSVRAMQFLVLAGKARALMHGRLHVSYEDLRALVVPILRHRVLLNFHAESDRLTSDDILRRLLDWKAAPRQ
jgi:MoxR-like ATPase